MQIAYDRKLIPGSMSVQTKAESSIYLTLLSQNGAEKVVYAAGIILSIKKEISFYKSLLKSNAIFTLLPFQNDTDDWYKHCWPPRCLVRRL